MSDSAYILVSLVVFALSVILVRAARTVALRKALLDMPNERSSHKIPVPRLGGAAFIPIVLIGLVALWWAGSLPLASKSAYLAGTIGLFAISLVDDFFTLSTTYRFIVQFAAARAPAGTAWVGVGVHLQNQMKGDWAEFDDFSLLESASVK